MLRASRERREELNTGIAVIVSHSVRRPVHMNKQHLPRLFITPSISGPMLHAHLSQRTVVAVNFSLSQWHLGHLL